MIFSFLASMCPIPGLFQWSHYDQSPGILIQGFGLFLWSDEIKSEIIKESLRNPRKLPKIFNILYFFIFPPLCLLITNLIPKMISHRIQILRHFLVKATLHNPNQIHSGPVGTSLSPHKSEAFHHLRKNRKRLSSASPLFDSAAIAR